VNFHAAAHIKLQILSLHNIVAVYVILVMALYQRKPRHADAENMVIFQDKPVSENTENFGGRKTKTVLATTRAPLQDCTTTVENTKIQLPRPAKQVTRLERTAY